MGPIIAKQIVRWQQLSKIIQNEKFLIFMDNYYFLVVQNAAGYQDLTRLDLELVEAT